MPDFWKKLRTPAVTIPDDLDRAERAKVGAAVRAEQAETELQKAQRLDDAVNGIVSEINQSLKANHFTRRLEYAFGSFPGRTSLE